LQRRNYASSINTTAIRFCRARQQVQYSGEYLMVDEQGNPQGQDMITMDEEDTFPEVSGINACYQLNATCLEEECEVMGRRNT
jgi:hypothetical protein